MSPGDDPIDRNPGPGSAQRRVFLMPDDLANQIAAGEVIERPASAVKELVENAFDAGARRVVVDLEEGGLRSIRVCDDGVGMSRADAELSVQRHATSKLRRREDLFSIRTLGFRGEALPSIASVSRFCLTTKPRGAIGGTRVMIEGGKLVSVGEAGAPPGTEISVKDLFFNTPARLKFLKQRTTELRHVVESLQQLAMAHPAIALRLTHNGRAVLELPSAVDGGARVFSLLGGDEAAGMFPLEPAVQDGVVCTGWFGQPALSRRTTAGIWTFVNGRFVRDKQCLSAVRVAYEGMVERGRYPVVVLSLQVPHDAVDVNVHPAKTEVRFAAPDAVFRAVRRAIAASLAAAPWGAAPRSGHRAREPVLMPHTPSQVHLPVRSYELHSWDDGGGVDTWIGVPGASRSLDGAGLSESDPPGALAPRRSLASGDPAMPGQPVVGDSPSPVREPRRAGPQGSALEAMPSGYFSGLHYIGAFRGTYLLASDGDGLVVVDQHAAHERITFEALRSAWRSRRYEGQPSLVPRVLSFDAIRAAALSAHLDTFARVGFEIEPFGDTEFALRSAPAILRSADHAGVIADALDELADAGHSARVDEAIDAVLLRMACHGSVRAGDRISRSEVDELFRALDAVDFGANCPHGRPVYFRMRVDEIETRFGRR